MDSPGPICNEVIADSEDEMDEDFGENLGIRDVANTLSPVSVFTLSGQLQNKSTSSISAFTAGPSAFRKQDSIADITNNQLVQLSDIDNFVSTAGIADRAKTRQRNPKTSILSPSIKVASSSNEQKSNASYDIIELTSDDDDDELNLRPSKLNPKARPKPKLKMKNKPRSDKNIDPPGAAEISTDKSPDTISEPRPRPRPRPLVKRSKTAHESTVPPSLDIPSLSSSSASSSHGPELPIATSPVRPYLHTSQLPLSDPPIPTLTVKANNKSNIESPGLFPTLHSRYEIAPRRSSLPMSELIRRANSAPGSPFATPHPRTSSSSTARPVKLGTGITTYSPYLKSSRIALSRIAPLHPNRRTPPPPPPPAPAKKKTKKELEMEERWEEEMIDSVGGISEWACLADEEKKELRKAKWAREMGDWDD